MMLLLLMIHMGLSPCVAGKNSGLQEIARTDPYPESCRKAGLYKILPKNYVGLICREKGKGTKITNGC